MACLLPVLAGFALPAAIIAWHAFAHLGVWSDPEFWRSFLNTLALAGTAAALTVVIGLFLGGMLPQTPQPS